MRIAVYPGSFDPLTNGHLDIIRRASRLFDRLIVSVADNAAKSPVFAAEERVAMIREAIRGIPRTSADSFSGLLVDHLRRNKATILIRGLRVVSDMDYEFQLASFNRKLCREAETVFLMPDDNHMYTASSMVKELARLGASVKAFVPPSAWKRLRAKYSR